MHRIPALLLGLGVVALLLVGTGITDVLAEENARAIDEIGIKRPLVGPQGAAAGSQFSTSQVDTIWVGYVPGSRSVANPYGVGVGGVWDFDSETAGTDSTQFWSFYLLSWRSESTTALPLPTDRPMWYFDHGNEANIGDTNLWLDRESRGMHSQNRGLAHTAGYLRTGIISYWHVDDMVNVSAPITGSSSAWCGLRGPNDFRYRDPVTGNPYTGDLARYSNYGGSLICGSWPGYGNQIEQILYHDVELTGVPATDVLTFSYRTDMSTASATENNGTAWFNPDPTTAANFIMTPAPAGPIDSLMVWVGLPQDGNAYDVNKRWLSEVLDFDSLTQPVKVFADTGLSSGNPTLPLPPWGAGTVVRVAFQVKTNRQYSDETYDFHGFDSVEGAALIDDIVVAGESFGFETVGEIAPRYPLPGDGLGVENSPREHWIATAKPPMVFGHIHSVFDLPYNDPCGALGSPDRLCDLMDNILVLSNHDDPDHAFFRESWPMAESPTIDLSSTSPITLAGVGDANHNLFRLEHQFWSGTMDLDQSVFWQWGARYWGPGFLQQADDLVPGWSNSTQAPFISFSPEPTCYIISSESDLDGIIPPPSQLDSMKVFVWNQTRCARFGATVLCGKPQGAYFDMVRAGFTGGEGSAITSQFWDLLADTFPFNEDVSPGTADFDTTTALIKQGLNNAASSGGEGVIIGDTLAVSSAFISSAGNPTRIDLVFRIKPGPGNYSVPGDPGSPLIEKDPTHPFWATYRADPGPFHKGVHGTGWNWDTWNSARMDSADNLNLSPLVGREIGIPIDDFWSGTLHEADPNYATLGITRNICFLVDPTGSVNELNICCSIAECGAAPFFETWPPSAYPAGTPTTTLENTKILPDGYFSPGTHIEYFMRRSDAPAGVVNWSVIPDTTVASQQVALGPHFDGQRFLEIGVFPDLWKDTRFGGDGLACIMVWDGADRRGQEDAIIGALDSLGYGKNNGAGRGWWEDDPSTSNPDPDDPDNWVFPNLGQKGLAFDWFDIQAAESQEGDRPGCRLAVAPPNLVGRQCKQGPTPTMLKTYYNTNLFFGGDIEHGAFHDGVDSQEQSDDVALFTDYLATSGPGTERAFYAGGDGIANDLANSTPASATLLSTYFGAILVSEDYRVSSANLKGCSFILNLIPEVQPPLAHGFNNSCLLFPDVVEANGAVPGAELAQRYEDNTDGDPSINPGLYGAAVYRKADNISRYYTTYFAGYQHSSLRDNPPTNCGDDFGRITKMANILNKAFGLCSAVGPVIAVGDMPGVQGAQLNFVRGAFPNPSISGMAKINFSLAQPAKVTFRFYNVAGRLVHEESVDYASGGPKVYNWSGQTSTGIRTAPGVYFYRLSAPGIEFQNNSQRMVFLGGK